MKLVGRRLTHTLTYTHKMKCTQSSLLLSSSSSHAEPPVPSSTEETLLDMGLVALTNLLQDDADNARRLAQLPSSSASSSSSPVPPIPVLVTRLLVDAAHRHDYLEEEAAEDATERLCIYMMALSVLCASDPGAQAQAAEGGACEAVVEVVEVVVVEEEWDKGEQGAALRRRQVLRQGCVCCVLYVRV